MNEDAIVWFSVSGRPIIPVFGEVKKEFIQLFAGNNGLTCTAVASISFIASARFYMMRINILCTSIVVVVFDQEIVAKEL